MAFDYTSLVETVVIPQIKDKGLLIEVTRKSGVSGNWEKKYDSITFEPYWKNLDTGSVQVTEPQDYEEVFTGSAVITDFTEEERVDTSVKAGDKKILTIELPEPKQGDLFSAQGVVYQYVGHVTVKPANDAVLYKIQVRV